MKTLADIVTDWLAACDCGRLGYDLFTGTISDAKRCGCGKCELCLTGCILFVEQSDMATVRCSDTLQSQIVIYSRGEQNRGQEIPFSRLMRAKKCISTLKRFNNEYKISFEFSGSIIKTKDQSGRHLYALTITAYYTNIGV